MPLSGSIIIGEVTPQVECGAFPAKRALGDTISVSADIFTHGTDMLGAELLFRKKGEDDWRRSAMRQGQDDRWQCEFRAEEIGAYQFTIEAWVDRYSTWLGNLKKWQLAGEDTAQDLKIGMAMLGEIASSSGSEGKAIAEIVARMQKAGQSHATEIASDARTVELATRNQKRDCTRFGKELEIVVESRLAGLQTGTSYSRDHSRRWRAGMAISKTASRGSTTYPPWASIFSTLLRFIR